MSEAPKFSFGATPASSGSTGSSLFGTTNNTGGSLFGGGSSSTAGSGFSFGNLGKAPETSKPEGQKSLFGAAASGGTSSLFGQQAGTGGSSSGFNLNQKPEENKTASPFGNFGNTQSTPAKTTAPAGLGSTQTSGLFSGSAGGNTTSAPAGSTTPASATAAPSFSFGGPSTTPAGPPPSSNAFGASTGGGGGGGGGGLFNLGSNAAQQGGGLFGQKPASQSESATTSSAGAAGQPAATSNLFGKTGGIFGNSNNTAQTGSSGFTNLFNKQPPQSSLGASSATPAASTEAPEAPKAPSFGFGQSTAGSAPSISAPSQSSSIQPPTGQPTSSLFGGSQPAASQPTPSLFGSNQPATSQTTSSLFSKPPSTAAGSSANKPTFTFPGQSTTSSSQASSSSSAAAATIPANPDVTKPLFGAAASSAASQNPSTAPTSAAPLFNLAGTSAATTSSQPASSLFSGFGNKSSTSASQPVASTTAPAPPGGGQPALSQGNTGPQANSGLGASTLSASTAGPVPPVQSRLRNKTMDEILTRWAADLTKYTKEFKTQAETVARWDQILVDNMNKITKLYTQTALSEKETASVEMQLTAVENQQNELDSWLSKYENEVEAMLEKNGPNQTEMGGPDQERERTYKLAEKLGERLEDMNRDLESMIEEVNSANTSLNKNSKADEPITQIVRILNSHLTQLQAIDQGTVALQAKVAEAQKKAQTLGYLNSGSNGTGGAAVEDFYRSYMGRR